jgi:GTPase Era involved in 16S rRNA processing
MTTAQADKTAAIRDMFKSFFQIYRDVSPYIALDRNQRAVITRRESWVARLEQAEFPVAFFGSFSAGKSTIINAILRREVLPESVKSTTAFPTVIRRGARDEAVVWYIDEATRRQMQKELTHTIDDQIGNSLTEARRPGQSADEYMKTVQDAIARYEQTSGTRINRDAFNKLQQLLLNWDRFPELSKTISLSEMKTYVEGHGDALFIDRIEVLISDINLPPDIILVDLPGLAVSNIQHVQFTKRYIQEQAKAFVVCMKPKHLLEGEEINFLDETNKENATILQRSFWVINQWDTQNELHRREEEQNFWSRVQSYHFAINPDRFFKVSALNFFLLSAIAEGRLDRSEKLAEHTSNLKTVDSGWEQLAAEPERARALLEQNEDVRAFAAFQRALFHYLNTTAKDEFLGNARGELQLITSELINHLTPLYSQYQRSKNAEQEMRTQKIDEEITSYVASLKERVRRFAREVRLAGQQLYWKEGDQEELEDEVRRMLNANRDDLKNMLRRGLDIDGDLSRLPGILQAHLQVPETLRDRVVQSVQESFILKISVLLADLKGVNKSYLPESLEQQLGDKLSPRDITMRLYGLADNLLFRYGEQLEAIGFGLRDVEAGTLDERITQALTRYEAGLHQFTRNLVEQINLHVQRTVGNHTEYLEQELLRLIDEHRRDIAPQIDRAIQLSETIAAELHRRQVIIDSYTQLIQLRASIP